MKKRQAYMGNRLKNLGLLVLISLGASGAAQTQTTISDALKDTLDTTYTATHIDTTKGVSQALMGTLAIEDLEEKSIYELTQEQINILSSKYLNAARRKHQLDSLQINNDLHEKNQAITDLGYTSHTPYLQEELRKRGEKKEVLELLGHGFKDQTLKEIIDIILNSSDHLISFKNPANTEFSIVISYPEKNYADAHLFLRK